MDNLKSKLLAHKFLSVLIGVLAIGGIVYGATYNGAPKINVEGDMTYNEAVETVETPVMPQEEQEELGAFPGPDIYTDYLNFNGVRKYFYNQRMRTATTTLCSFKAPNATTTYAFSYNIDLGTSVASAFVVATSTTATATSTLNTIVSDRTVASGLKDNLFVFPSSGTSNQVSPSTSSTTNTYFLLHTAGVGLNGYTYGGTCSLELTEY